MSQLPNRRPMATEYNQYYAHYINQIPDGDLLQQLEDQINKFQEFCTEVAESDSMVLHAPYTWTFKQVLGHIIDGERVFGYRILRFASDDLQPVPGFDQDLYVANNDYTSPKFVDLVNEWIHCRKANIYLLRRIKPETWDNSGTASEYLVTVRALAYILVGHVIHHLKILKERKESSFISRS